jgi:hypothetical protein
MSTASPHFQHRAFCHNSMKHSQMCEIGGTNMERIALLPNKRDFPLNTQTSRFVKKAKKHAVLIETTLLRSDASTKH